jgi:Na+-driven multidrug efflux pump
MLATGSLYLRAVGPFYGFFGAGLALYFAAQGAGRVGWPVAASLLRMVVALGGAWTASALGFGLSGIFLAMSAGFVVMGLVNAAAFATGSMIPRAAIGEPSFGPLPLAPASKP